MQIPKRYIQGFAQLASLTDEQFEALLSNVSSSSKILNESELSSAISKLIPSIKLVHIKQIIDAVISALALLEDSSIPSETFLKSLELGFRESSDFEEMDGKIPMLVQRLKQIVSQGGILRTISKTTEIVGDNERNFGTARILTDLRPVFRDTISEGPEGFAILHTVKLAYYEDFRPHEFYIVMNSNEIQQLKSTLERALEKASCLKSLLSRSSLNCFEPDLDGQEEYS